MDEYVDTVIDKAWNGWPQDGSVEENYNPL